MACSLKVLVNVSNEMKEMLTDEEIQSLKVEEGIEKHKKILQKVYAIACQGIISEGDPDGVLFHAVDYIKEQAMDFEDAQAYKGYGFGATKPDEIKEEILSWNREQSMNFIRLLGEFEKLAKQKGFKKLTELFTSSMTKDGQIPEMQFQYPVSIYELRKALDAIDGVFTYGQSMIFYDKDNGAAKPYIPVDVINAAVERPEDFLILEVYYD
jgi:hypothetical protein